MEQTTNRQIWAKPGIDQEDASPGFHKRTASPEERQKSCIAARMLAESGQKVDICEVYAATEAIHASRPASETGKSVGCHPDWRSASNRSAWIST